MPKLKPAAILCCIALIATTLAGCTDPSPPIDAFLLIKDSCLPDTEATCTVEDGVIVLHDLAITGQGRLPGIALAPTHSNIRLENVSVSGFDIALVMEFSDCPDCRMSVRNARLQAATLGLLVQGTRGTIDLERVEIETPGGGHIEGGDGQTISSLVGGTDGIQLPASEMHLNLRDVEIRAVEQSVGGGIANIVAGLASLHVDGLRISNYRRALVLAAREVELRDVWIDSCMLAIGMEGVDHTPFIGKGIHVRGCWGGSIAVRYATTILEDIDLDGGIVGISDLSVNFTIRNFRIQNMEYGIQMWADNIGPLSGTYENGWVANNSYAGIRAKHESVLVRNVTFLNNGHKWPDTRDRADPSPGAYGGLMTMPPSFQSDPAKPRSVVVTDSSFIGNEPYGLSNPSLFPADARGNWWNSADGPQIYPFPGGALPSIGAGHGDNVSSTVQFVPFLLAPP